MSEKLVSEKQAGIIDVVSDDQSDLFARIEATAALLGLELNVDEINFVIQKIDQ